MSKEIKELDMNKYIVVKREDVLKYLDNVPPEDRPDKEEQFYNCLNTIARGRDADNKPKNKYLVLNLDDDIDLEHFGICASAFWEEEKVTVRDISLHLVNAILKTKDKQ